MRKPSFLAILIIIIVSCAVYATTLFNGFVYDDVPQVLENLWIIELANIPRIFASSAWSFMGDGASYHYYRPMMHTIYAFEYQLFTLNPLYYHLVNILIHVLNSVMVFGVAFLLLNKKREGEGLSDGGTFVKDFPTLPFIAAIFFTVHPVMTESVAWVAAIPELSYTAFFLLSFYLYIRSSASEGSDSTTLSILTRPAYIFSAVFFFVALFCKEPAMTLLPVLVAYDYISRKKFFTFSTIVRYLPFVVLAVIYLIIRNNALGGLAPKFSEHSYLSVFQNILNVGPLVLKYFSNLLVPMKFSPFYVFYPVLSIAELTALYSWVLLVALLVIYIYLFAKKSLAFVPATLLLAPLLPVLYIPALSTSVFAVRYLYLPVAGFTIIMALIVRTILSRQKLKGTRGAIMPIAVVLVILFALASFKTIKRGQIWRDDLTLWAETVRLYPKNYHAYNNLAKSYMESGEVELAKKAYNNSIRFNKQLPHPKMLTLAESWYNLGLLEFNSNEIERAIDAYRQSLRIKVKPTLTRDVLNNLGNAYATGGYIDEAIRSYEQALAIDPNDTYVRHNLEAVRKWKKK